MSSPTWPYVEAFAKEMEEKLVANRHKGDREGWMKDTPEALFERLEEEVKELAESLRLLHSMRQSLVSKDALLKVADRVTKEAADVGNFAMMIADVCGGLKVK